MSKKQRNQNRANAAFLRTNALVCDRCGTRGSTHLVCYPQNLFQIMAGERQYCVRTCPDLPSMTNDEQAPPFPNIVDVYE